MNSDSILGLWIVLQFLSVALNIVMEGEELRAQRKRVEGWPFGGRVSVFELFDAERFTPEGNVIRRRTLKRIAVCSALAAAVTFAAWSVSRL